jgi:hypothetical protein
MVKITSNSLQKGRVCFECSESKYGKMLDSYVEPEINLQRACFPRVNLLRDENCNILAL